MNLNNNNKIYNKILKLNTDMKIDNYIVWIFNVLILNLGLKFI